MASAVLDSFAVLAFLFKERGHQKVVGLLEEAADSDGAAFIAAPNWAEVRYIVEWRTLRERVRRSRAASAVRAASLIDDGVASLAMALDPGGRASLVAGAPAARIEVDRQRLNRLAGAFEH